MRHRSKAFLYGLVLLLACGAAAFVAYRQGLIEGRIHGRTQVQADFDALIACERYDALHSAHALVVGEHSERQERQRLFAWLEDAYEKAMALKDGVDPLIIANQFHMLAMKHRETVRLQGTAPASADTTTTTVTD